MLYLFFQNLESEFIPGQPSLAPQGAHFGQKRSDWTEQFEGEPRRRCSGRASRRPLVGHVQELRSPALGVLAAAGRCVLGDDRADDRAPRRRWRRP